MFATDSSTPHTFACLHILCSGPPVPSEVLALHIDNKARRSRRRCRRKPVLPSAPCVHKYTQPYTVDPPQMIQSFCTHRCTPGAESSTTPTQCCVMTAKQPSPAAPHTVTHSRPSPCTRIHTHVPRTPDVASRSYSIQVKPVLRRSQYCNKPVSEIHLLYTRVPPCPRKSSCPKYVQSYRHPFAAATPWPVPCP